MKNAEGALRGGGNSENSVTIPADFIFARLPAISRSISG
jgi:hypothetical protein